VLDLVEVEVALVQFVVLKGFIQFGVRHGPVFVVETWPPPIALPTIHVSPPAVPTCARCQTAERPKSGLLNRRGVLTSLGPYSATEEGGLAGNRSLPAGVLRSSGQGTWPRFNASGTGT
jgi:hypothetical protein